MKFQYKIGDNFSINDKIMIIVDLTKNYNYKASSEPYKNYIVELYDSCNRLLNDIRFSFCLNMEFQHKKYKYIINERILICNDDIKKINL